VRLDADIPLPLKVVVRPERARPGDVLLVRVFAPFPVERVWGSFEGRELLFVKRGGEYRALAGVSREARPGKEGVCVKASLPDGRVAEGKAEVLILPRRFKVQRLRVPKQKRPFLSEELLEADYRKLREAAEELFPEPLWVGNFLMPVKGRITTGYGWRRFVGCQPRGQHSGWDIAAPRGTPVRAPNEGIVKFAGDLYVHGKTVVIDHGAGVVSYLLHLERILARPGQRVRRGEVVGEVGSTGLATAPHLHWSLHVQRTAVDPGAALSGRLPRP